MREIDTSSECEFTVTCRMSHRWAEQFVGMLYAMERLGRMGLSRSITFYADGDGDFRPRFLLPPDILPTSGHGSDGLRFDAS